MNNDKVIAATERFVSSMEVFDTFKRMGVNYEVYRDADSLTRLNPATLSFVFDINYHRDIHQIAVESKVPYVVWSFDSGVEGIVDRDLLRGNQDFLFLANRQDYANCAEYHENSHYMPFSAASFFIKKPRANDFKHKIIAIINSYQETANDCESDFAAFMDRSGPAYQKKLSLIKSLLELTVDNHIDIISENRLSELLTEYIVKCGVDPFEGDTGLQGRLCDSYGQILSFLQRGKLIRVLSLGDMEFSVFGDGYWSEVLKDLKGGEYFGHADFKDLASLYNGSAISLNLTQIQNLANVPQRVFHQLAAGSFVLSNHSEELASLFTPGIHLETFSSWAELLDKASYYQKNPDLRLRIAENGQKEFLRAHRMESKFKKIFDLLSLIK